MEEVDQIQVQVNANLNRLVPRSTCCGLISLRIALILTTLLDITIGIQAGALIYYIITTHNFAISLSFKASLEFIKSLMAVIILTLMLVHQETQNKGHKLTSFRVYFQYSLLTALILPVIDLSTLIQLHVNGSDDFTKTGYFALGVWVLYIIQCLGRFYLVYLSFGYYRRLRSGELLLIELGPRKLRRLIAELKAE